MRSYAGIETYAVGFLRDWITMWSRLRNKEARKQLRPIRSFFRWFRESWYRMSYWNGYLAEWHYPPVGLNHHKCGKGWTRRAARRRLMKHILRENLTQLEEWRMGISESKPIPEQG